MGKSVGSPPPPPDPVAMSQAQGAANKDTAVATARLNAVDSNSPFGNVTYTETPSSDPSVPHFTQNTTFSPGQQHLFDTQNNVEQQAYDTAATGIGNARDVLSTPFSLKNLPGLQTGVSGGPAPLFGIDKSNLSAVPLTANDFAAQGKQAQDAVMSRFNEDFPKRQEDAASKLNAQGIQLGSQGYGDAMNTLDRGRNDAMAQAILAGNQEQNNLFGQAMASRGQVFGENQAQQSAFNAAQGQQFGQGMQNASLNNQGRQQSISEQQLLRSQPINEIATLLGLGSGIQTPNAAPNFGINVGNTDVLGAYGLQQQSLQNAYNQKMGANNAMWGALGNLGGSLGGAAILASDRRVKNVMRRVGRTGSGIPVYLYAYKDRPGVPIVGVMAQDVRRANPLAVHDIGGTLHVNYAMVM